MAVADESFWGLQTAHRSAVGCFVLMAIAVESFWDLQGKVTHEQLGQMGDGDRCRKILGFAGDGGDELAAHNLVAIAGKSFWDLQELTALGDRCRKILGFAGASIEGWPRTMTYGDRCRKLLGFVG